MTQTKTLKLPPELVGPKPSNDAQERPPAKPKQGLPKVAHRARLEKRHHWIGLSFLACVGLPAAIIGFYLWIIATPQFASTMAFSIQEPEGGPALDFLGGLTDLSGTTSKDADILYDFIQSQQMVVAVGQRLDLHALWQRRGDPVFTLRDAPTVEDLHRFWQRMVRVQFDGNAGLVEVRVLAFSAEGAHGLAHLILQESKKALNDLSQALQDDATRFARLDLELTTQNLQSARDELTSYRSQHQILDPQADIESRLGLLNSLQNQKAQALIEFDLLQTSQTRKDDPRIALAQRRIEIVDGLIQQERNALGNVGQQDLAKIMSKYESLAIDLEFAQQSYIASKAAYDTAAADAARTAKYLAAHISPTQAERAEYPKRLIWMMVFSGAAFLFWAIGLLIFYSIRDRR